MATEKRTDEEIVARIQEVSEVDIFGFQTQVLVPHLDFEAAQPYLKEEVTAEDWAEVRAGVKSPAEEGADYLPFAIGKIEDERGLSAGRSVQKFAEWAWLDGETALAEQLDDESNYGWYGDKAVRMYADHYDLPWSRGEK